MKPSDERPDIHSARGGGEPIRPEVARWLKAQGGVVASLLSVGINETDLLIIAERLERPDDRVRRIVREELNQAARQVIRDQAPQRAQLLGVKKP